MTTETTSVAAAYLALLKARGVDYLFGNAGTDFAPLIEAFGQAAQRGTAVPRPILAAHENLAVSMAHGYAMVTRRIPAVMVHVSVGTARLIAPRLTRAAAASMRSRRAPSTLTSPTKAATRRSAGWR